MAAMKEQSTPKSGGSATAYLQSVLGGEVAEAEEARKKVAREALWRKGLAYALKGLAVLGGLVLAAGVVPPMSQALGLAISGAVTLDFLLSNHQRLLTVVTASQAYRRLLREVARTHRRELPAVLELKSTDSSQAEKELNQLNSRLVAKLHSDCDAIETALDEADLKALKNLSLDPERGTPR
ncbi:MAG: hypothetical protein D6692_08940 [Planctomycetota bacterium]|nr:MAG: hypothetical protein D6692_08940 [Planctomycetota bacterium]